MTDLVPQCTTSRPAASQSATAAWVSRQLWVWTGVENSCSTTASAIWTACGTSPRFAPNSERVAGPNTLPFCCGADFRPFPPPGMTTGASGRSAASKLTTNGPGR